MHNWTFMLLAGALHLAFWVLLVGGFVWVVLRLRRTPAGPARSRAGGWTGPVGVALIAVALLGGVIAMTTSVNSAAMDEAMGRHMGEMMGGGDTQRRAPAAEAGATTQRVVAGDFFFRPDKLRVPAGGSLNIAFTNGGRMFHTFTIRELDFDLRARPGATISGALQNAEPGAYDAVCTVPGHAEAGMRATVAVTPQVP